MVNPALRAHMRARDTSVTTRQQEQKQQNVRKLTWAKIRPVGMLGGRDG